MSAAEGGGAIDPTDAGYAALNRQAWLEASVHFIATLERTRDHPSARSGLGIALIALGEEEEGLAQLQEAVRLEPNPDWVCNLASGLIRLGRRTEAEQLLRGILDIVPNHEAARANWAVLCTAQDRESPHSVSPAPHASRKEEVRRLLETAARHMAAKGWSEAVDGLRAVLTLAPDLAEARAALGSVLLVLGRAEEAVVELWRVAHRLNTSEAWNNLGWAQGAAGCGNGARVPHEGD